MTHSISKNNPESFSNATQRILRTASISYGLFVGLGFALFVWGYDGILLATISADMAWAKFLIGLPCALLIGAVAGFLGHKSPHLALTFGIWILTLGGLSWLAGHIPFEGLSWLAGWLDSRFADVSIFPYLPTNAFRTRLVILINSVLGLVAGYGQMLFVNWAWDHSTADGKLSPNSWLVLVVASLIALLPAISINQFIMKPLRLSNQRVANLVNLTLDGGLEVVQKQGQNTIEAERYGAHFSSEFTLHFVGFDQKTTDLYTTYTDIVFEDGFTLRCIVMGKRVTFCEEYNQKLRGWMDDLIHAGLTGERRWLANTMKKFQPEEHIIQWMQTHQAELSAPYTMKTVAQKGNWRLIEVAFDQQPTIVCRFHGIRTITVDYCAVPTP